MIKLYVTDQGDPSVGIFAQTYVVDTPFHPDDYDTEEMDWFRKQIEAAYKEFAEGRLVLQFDIEKDDEETLWI
jgi:hypothetical protein